MKQLSRPHFINSATLLIWVGRDYLLIVTPSMSAKTSFVDTNILVYAYDVKAGDKQETAQLVLEQLWKQHSGVLSTQVLQEFYVTVTQKLPKPLPLHTARDVVRTYFSWDVYELKAEDSIAASELQERHKMSFWDALVLVAAEKCGASELLTEDTQFAHVIGQVHIVNPLIASPKSS